MRGREEYGHQSQVGEVRMFLCITAVTSVNLMVKVHIFIYSSIGCSGSEKVKCLDLVLYLDIIEV